MESGGCNPCRTDRADSDCGGNLHKDPCEADAGITIIRLMDKMEQTLKIYFTSDVHGYFYPTTYGDLKRKDLGLFSFARDFKKDENTLVIDGGDILQGSAFAYYCRPLRIS